MIIGIAGKAGSGKDSAALHIVNKYNFTRYAFADPIKEICNKAFGWNLRHSFGDLKEIEDPFWKFSPRKAYQICGTEFGRNLNPDLWLLAWERNMFAKPYTENWVIPDVRFENEVNFIKQRHGRIIHIVRKDIKAINDHVSENGVEFCCGDYIVINESTFNCLYAALDIIIEQILAKDSEESK
jgi:hypothetical protein